MITILEVLNKCLKKRIYDEIPKYNEDIRRKGNNYYTLGKNINDTTYWLVQLFSDYFYTNNMNKPTTEMRKRLKCSYADGYGKKEAIEIYNCWIDKGDKFKEFSDGLSDGEKDAILNALRNKNISINDIDEIPDLLFNRLKEIIDSFPEKKPSKKDTSQNYRFITQPPVRPSNVFEGREDDISKILKLSESDKIALVNGIGGIGKTTICRYIFWDIADNSSKDTTTLAWITYKESLKSSFYLAFEEINADNPDDYYLQAQHMINQYGTNLLLFIDNANDISDEEVREIRKFSCKVIITSRSKLDSIETYFVDHLNKDTCILIYKKYSGDSKDESNEYIKEIVKLADYHTITIELIAKIQKANHTNAEKMLAILNEKGFNLENITSKISVDNGYDKAEFNKHMAKLFDISNITDEEEKRELGLFSLLEANLPVDFDTISQLFKKSENDDTDFDFEPIDELIRKGWLSETEDNDKVFMHPVISDVVRQLLSPQFDDCQKFILAIDELLSNTYNNDYLTKNVILSHAVKVLNYFDNINSMIISAPLSSLGSIYFEFGELDTAIMYYYKAIITAENCLEPEITSYIIQLYINTAHLFSIKFNYKEALKLYKKALKASEEYIIDDIITVDICNRIADIYNLQCDFNNEEHFRSRALVIYHTYIANQPNTPDAYIKNAEISKELGEYGRALTYLYNALIINEKGIGLKKRFDKATVYNNIAYILKEQGEYNKALEFYYKALEIQEAKTKTTPRHTAGLYKNMASIYQYQGKYDKALEFYHKASVIYEEYFGSENLDKLNVLFNIAGIYLIQGKYDEALILFNEALLKFENLYGTEHLITANVYYNLGIIYYHQGNYKKALEFYNKVLLVYENEYGTNHYKTAYIYHIIGQLYFVENNFKEALKFNNKAFESYNKDLQHLEKFLPSEDPLIIEIKRKIIELKEIIDQSFK